jgi:hypothetical protein
MKRIIPIALVLLLLCTAIGCSNKSAAREGDSYYANSASQYYADAEYEAAYEPEAPAEAAYGFTNESKTSASQSPALSNRKIIRNADLTVETLQFDTFLEKLSASVGSFGGYVESSSLGDRGYRNGQQLHYARYTIRVPAEQLDAFLNTVSDLGNVTSLNTGLRDVTTNYVDSEKHLESLRVEQQALLEILAKAETVEDIITVQDRLTYVRYEIESYEAILRTYDDQIALSSVNLTVNEVERETPVEKETFGQEVSRRFNESLTDVGDSCKNFAAGFLGNSPIILVTVLILGLIVLVVVLIIKGTKKHYAKKRAKAQNNTPKE